MVTLAKHIETLLLDNDCVVVPNFGGFIAHYQSAYFDEKTSTFFPPQRIIGFNPKLIMNDGLLVQSYMQALDTDFSDANLHIENEVDELKDQLYRDGNVNLANIGSLSCNSDGSIHFVAADKIIDTPSLYGLSDFQCFRVKSSNKRVVQIYEDDKNRYATTNSDSRRSIGTSFLGSALGVAVALLLFFFLSVPVENSYVDNENYAYLGDAGLFNSIKSKSFVANVFEMPSSETKSKVSVEKKVDAAEKIEVTKASESTSSDEIKAVDDNASKEEIKPLVTDKKFHVIISSTSSEIEANSVVGQLLKKGYKDATIILGKGYYKYRISICNVDDESSAYNKVNQLRANNSFDDAWVLSSK